MVRRNILTHSFPPPSPPSPLSLPLPHPGFNGIIHVLPMQDKQTSLTLKVNSMVTNLPPSLTCTQTSSPFDHYTFSVSHTPTLTVPPPTTWSAQDTNQARATGLAMVADSNLFTIGGKSCLMASFVSATLTEPDYSGPADSTLSYYAGAEFIGCELGDNVEPGKYRPFLHVAGRGWALVTEEEVVEVVPAYGPDHSHLAGSLRGGLELAVSLRGLTEEDITKTRVEIGNTPCPVQRMDPDLEKIFCITQPARDDGYSSLVFEDGAVAYWSLQADYFDLDGRFVNSDGATSYRNHGSIGESIDAVVQGEVGSREEGISGNTVTDQAVLFNASYIEVPFHSYLAHPGGFGMGLWLKIPQASASPAENTNYRIIVDHASISDGIARGYLLLLNPCGQPEFWAASGLSLDTFTGSDDCLVIADSISQCTPTPTACSGYSVVAQATNPTDLPPGVWNIIRCSDCDLSGWSFIALGWEADEFDGAEDSCTAESLCSGSQVFHYNNRFVDSLSSTHLPAVGTNLLIGGTERLPVGVVNHPLWAESQLASFTGHVDEVSVYVRPLSSGQVEVHYEYGSSDKQRIWIRVETVDGVGDGVIPDLVYASEWTPDFSQVVEVDWDGASGEEMVVSEGVALRFTWSR